jgi:hypothetical protein
LLIHDCSSSSKGDNVKVKYRIYDDDHGMVRLHGMWYERDINVRTGECHNATCWSSDKNAVLIIAAPSAVHDAPDDALEARIEFNVLHGSKKFFERLEKLWAMRNDPQPPKESKPRIQRFPREPEPENSNQPSSDSAKASESAAIFESTDPRYALKLFITTSKKFPGYVNLHVYQNPMRQHKFYTVVGEVAIRETEKFLAHLKQVFAKKS